MLNSTRGTERLWAIERSPAELQLGFSLLHNIMSIFLPSQWCEEYEMNLRNWTWNEKMKLNGFVSHEVPFPAPSDWRSQVAGNGTKWFVKTIALSSPTSWGEQWAFLDLHYFTAVKKTVPKFRKGSWLVEAHWKHRFQIERFVIADPCCGQREKFQFRTQNKWVLHDTVSKWSRSLR